MTDLRRTLLWVVFSMSLVLLWDAWNQHNGKPTMFGMPSKPAATAPAGSAPGGAGVPSATTAAAAAPGTAALPATGAAASATSEKITITTDVIKATVDTRGGTLVRLELTKYTDETQGGPVVLLDQATHQYVAESGLATLNGVAQPNHQTTFTAVPAERSLAAGADAVTLRLESPAVGGVKLTKTYTFPRGRYDVAVRHEVENVSATALSPQLYLQLVRDSRPLPNESSFYSTFTGPAMYTEANKFHKVDFSDIAKGKLDHDKRADNGWIAMVQHYFTSAWLVPAPKAREFNIRKEGADLYAIAMTLPLGELAPGAKAAQDAKLFAGPQEEKTLESLAPGLDLVKDYGWLTVLSKPLFKLLVWLHGLFGNWGWAIIALVVILKAAFYWLNANAYKSMAKMKAINPRVQEMRERLKDKPQQMQQEMMRMYREEKVNPLGGCLPIVVQIPFFIALYWVLLSSVEMRNAPWIGWIHDLSARDPFFILPLLMTASSLVQTWLSPTPPDPVQAKMMWIMPLVFSVMFFFFPAGLVLYWLTNNILSIAQQWFINKRLGVLGTK